MIVKAQAKVNIALDIVGVLENGYHDLDMIMAPVSIFDTIEIKENEIDLVTCENYDIPKINTVSKMIVLVKKTFGIQRCFHVHIQKDIPMMSGMAGGSADAAAVLKTILEMEKIDCSYDMLIDLGKQIGADVPFCIVNQWARVKGIGEKITCLHTNLKLNALIIKPDEGVSTPQAFKLWHEKEPLKVDVDTIQQTIVDGNIDALMKCMENTLEPVAKDIVPILNDIQKDMENCGIQRVMMSGSGSSMMGFSTDLNVLKKAKYELENKYPFVRVVTIG